MFLETVYDDIAMPVVSIKFELIIKCGYLFTNNQMLIFLLNNILLSNISLHKQTIIITKV